MANSFSKNYKIIETDPKVPRSIEKPLETPQVVIAKQPH